MNKKIWLSIVTLCLVICLVLSFGACKKKNKDSSATNETSYNEGDSGNSSDVDEDPPVALTPEQQKALIAETLTGLSVADILGGISLPEEMSNELSDAVDKLADIFNTVLNYGKKYALNIYHEEVGEALAKDYDVSVAMGNGQIALNVTQYDYDETEGESSSLTTFHLVNKNGDLYVVPFGEVEGALYAFNVNEAINYVKGVLSGETKIEFEDVIGTGIIPPDVAEQIVPVVESILNYKLPALTAEDLKTDNGFYYLDKEYLTNVMTGLIDKIAVAVHASAEEISEVKTVIPTVINWLNLHIGFKADSKGINALLVALTPDNDMFDQIEAPIKDLNVRFEYNGLRAFESCSLNASMTMLRDYYDYYYDEFEEEVEIHELVEMGTLAIDFTANKQGANGTFDVVIAGEEEPANIHGELTYAVGKKLELDVNIANSGMGYAFGAENDNVNFDFIVEKKNGGYALDAKLGIEGYANVIDITAGYGDKTANVKEFWANFYIDPEFADMFGFPIFDLRAEGTVSAEGTVAFDVAFEVSGYDYEDYYDDEMMGWVDYDVEYTQVFKANGSFNLGYVFQQGKVPVNITVEHGYKDIVITQYGEEVPVEDYVFVMKSTVHSLNSESMRIVISAETVVDATGTTLTVTIEIQAVMQDDNPEQGWSAGDWVTGMAG
ncbi:MAG: hypothetical protein J6Z34_06375, partial [Clostridia bacterium]|nr:hypothetical protein [Clostridia bacterium]